MKNVLIIYAHPAEKSFNAAIRNTIVQKLETDGTDYNVIDLYEENYNPVLSAAEMEGEISRQTKWHQLLIKMATDIIFIFPVWWFRAPAILEGFIDKTFVPKFAYQFKPIIGKFGIPIPLLKDKQVTVMITHGAPALPVKTLYVNLVKYRFLLGFLSFCFNIFRCKMIQFWSVPFITETNRKKYLKKVERVIGKRIKPAARVIRLPSKVA